MALHRDPPQWTRRTLGPVLDHLGIGDAIIADTSDPFADESSEHQVAAVG